MMNRSMAEPTTYYEAICNRFKKGMRIPIRYYKKADEELKVKGFHTLQPTKKLLEALKILRSWK